MNLYLIRHGRQSSSLCNVDVRLAEEGIKQAELLGKRLESYQVDALYSSKLIRAVETAAIINQYLGQKHILREELKEISFGRMEGHTNEYISNHFAEFKEEQMKLLEDIPYPGGECGSEVYNRAMPVIREIIQSGKKKAVVVTHGGVIRALLAGILGLDFSQKLLFANSLENTSITELIYDKSYDRFYLQRFNDYAHLEPEPELLRHYW